MESFSLLVTTVSIFFTVHLSNAFENTRSGNQTFVSVNGAGILNLNVSMSRHCKRITLTLNGKKQSEGIRIAISFKENITEPSSLLISEGGTLLRRVIPTTMNCSPARFLSVKIIIDKDGIDFNVGERWRMMYKWMRLNEDDISIGTDHNEKRCCVALKDVNWLRNYGSKPFIRIKTAILHSDSIGQYVEGASDDSSDSHIINNTQSLVEYSMSSEYNLTEDEFLNAFSTSITNSNSWSSGQHRWSSTFFIFLGIEMFFIGLFILFGLSMFVWLQTKPKRTSKSKRIASIL